MEIVMIRHFMTPGNVSHRYIGTTDESLLPGQTAAFAYPAVEAVAVSPMKRCVETAKIIYPGVK
ncbi:MAG: histidine phosphatase family protein, partial [Dorea sp.]|nr:histidine phosphatase family protein [Dorea sp.]